MSTKPHLTVRVGADDSAARSTLAALARQIWSGALLSVGHRLVGALSQIPVYLSQATRIGIAFNDQLENATISIAGVLKGIAPDQFKTFDSAMATSAAVVEELKQQAKETRATFGELLDQFQGSASIFARANIPLEKWTKTAQMLSQAVAGIGLPAWQARMETIQLLSGRIDRNAVLAQRIGLTSAKAQELTRAGGWYEYLSTHTQIKGFIEAAQRGTQTLSGLASNIKDVFMELAASVTGVAFEVIKQGMKEFLDLMQQPNFKSAFSSLSTTLTVLAKHAVDFMLNIVKYLPAFDTAIKLLVTGLMTVKSAFVAVGATLGGMAAAWMAVGPWRNEQVAAIGKTTGQTVGEEIRNTLGFLKELWTAQPLEIQTPSSKRASKNVRIKSAMEAASSGAFDSTLSRATGGFGSSGLFATWGAFRAWAESTSISKSMLQELREINETLKTGVPITEEGGLT